LTATGSQEKNKEQGSKGLSVPLQAGSIKEIQNKSC
jgi:hypothetical protein